MRPYYVFILINSLLIANSFAQTDFLNECLDGWDVNRDDLGGPRCYLIYGGISKNFDDANTYCSEVTEGYGYLLSVDLERVEEAAFIKDKFTKTNHPGWEFYTSGVLNFTNPTDTHDRSFRWVGDGKEFHTDDPRADWLTSRDQEGIVNPQQSDRPPRVIIYKSSRGEGDSQVQRWGWSFVSEDLPRKFVCEMDLLDVRHVKWPRKLSYGDKLVEDRYILHGPIFTRQPLNGFYVSKSHLTFVATECIADGWPTPQYTWYRYTSRNKVERVQPSDRYVFINGRMMIFDATYGQDHGDYFCRATNAYGSVISHTIQISQASLKQFPPTNRQPIGADKKMRAIIECNPPSYNPSVRFNWFKNHPSDFINPERKPHVFVSYNGKLYFSAVQESDVGLYYCRVSLNVAESSRDSVSRQIELRVREGGQAEAIPKIFDEFPTTFARNPPELTTTKSVLRGQGVRFECVAHGTGKLTYTWNRNDRRPLSERVEFTYGDNNRSFIINNVQPEDAGIYWCIVINDMSETNRKSVTLTVQSMPIFVIPLRDRVLDYGQSFKWRCEATGDPAVTYSWFKNGEPFGPDEVARNKSLAGRIEFNRLFNIITFSKVQFEDNGMYQCAATNTYAVRYSSKQLKVLRFKPNFDKRPLPMNTFTSVDGNVTVPCVPEGAPYPEISWFQNGRNLTLEKGGNRRVRMLHDGGLYINSAEATDQGEYMCVAVSRIAGSEFGRANDTTRLTVLEQTKFDDRPTTVTVMVNETAVFKCMAFTSLQLDLTYVWLHNGRPLVFENETARYQRGNMHEAGGNWSDLVIPKAQFADEGRYTCQPTTPSDSSRRHDADLVVIGPPGEPYGISAGNQDAETVNISFWKAEPHGDEVQGYLIEGFQKYNPQWELYDNFTIDELDVIKGRYSAIVGQQRKLHPWNSYMLRVKAYNSYGVGKASRETEAFQTDSTKPRYVPQNVTGGGGKEGTLVLKWQPLPAYNACGPGLGYEISYKRESQQDSDYQKVNKSGSEFKHVVWVGVVNYYKPYNVRIRAFNDKGMSKFYSKVATVFSAEKVPDARPSGLRAISYNGTALMVYWNQVEDTRENVGGKLMGYKVDYWKRTNETKLMFKRKTILGQHGKTLIIGLESHTYYRLEVNVFNSAGNGLPTADKVFQQTLRLPPQFFPTEVHLYPDGANSIRVVWRGVSTGRYEEPLQGYRVRYWRRGESMMHALEIDTAKKTEAVIYGLKQNKKYNMRVYGYSRGGEGKMSSPTTIFSIGPDCNVYEDDPEAEFVYLCSMDEAERYAGILEYSESGKYLKYSERFKRFRGAASVPDACFVLIFAFTLHSVIVRYF